MKTAAIWIVGIVIVAIGAWYLLMSPAASPSTDSTGSPQAAMGTNGSADQGNMGQPNSGAVQNPMADEAEGMVIGNNLALQTKASAKLGTYLVGYNNMTVYTKSTDTATASTCYGDCAKNWPPYIIGPEDNLDRVKPVVTGKVGTIIRTDGKIQVTYNDKPLYFYASDKTSADVTGEGVGGVWHVAKP